MTIPVVGDGEYVDRGGNSNETLYVGKGGRTVVVGGAAASVTLGASGAAPVLVGGTSSAKVGFYGATPVVQRPYSSAVHATSAQASSSDFGATQLATLQEIMKTLIGLGIYATA